MRLATDNSTSGRAGTLGGGYKIRHIGFHCPARLANIVQGGSGIRPLRKAREWASEKKIKYRAIKDGTIKATGLTNTTIDPFKKADDPNIRLLAGARGCSNGNNDSLTVLVTYRAKKLLITGEAESTSEADCGSEIRLLLDRYQNSDLLDVDLYIVGHHGSDNGTTTAFLQRMTPEIVVISAGKKQPQTTFSAWGYGHPRQSAIERLEAAVAGTRPQKVVYAMPGQHTYQEWIMNKAIYCTCWDGNVV